MDRVCHCNMHGLQGYKEVEDQDSEAADEPGQVFDDEGPSGAAQGGQDHDDAQPIGAVAHHGQGEQQVGRPLCRVPLVLQWAGFYFQWAGCFFNSSNRPDIHNGDHKDIHNDV